MIQTNTATANSQHAANLNDVSVSVYQHAKDNTGKTMRLATVMQSIVSGESPYGKGETVRAMVDRLRSMRKGSPEHTTMKKQIPCFIPQGVFTKRGKAHIKTPAELMVIDIDNMQSMAEAEAYRDGLRDDPHVYAAFVSPSGDGVKILVRTLSALLSLPPSTCKSFTMARLRQRLRGWIGESRTSVTSPSRR